MFCLEVWLSCSREYTFSASRRRDWAFHSKRSLPSLLLLVAKTFHQSPRKQRRSLKTSALALFFFGRWSTLAQTSTSPCKSLRSFVFFSRAQSYSSSVGSSAGRRLPTAKCRITVSRTMEADRLRQLRFGGSGRLGGTPDCAGRRLA